MRAHRVLALGLFLLGGIGAVPLPVTAQETVIYKCTDAHGNVTMQNATPCAAGMKQEIRRVGMAPTVPVPVRRAPEPAPEPAAPAYGEFVLVAGPTMARTPAPEAAALPPPPPLFQCTTWDGASYFGDTATPDPRCAPLQVVGIDGSNATARGQACEMRQDSCAAIPEDQLCAAWYRRLDEAEFKLRYASAQDRGGREAARADIEAKIRASRCSPEPPKAPAQTPPPAPVP